MVELKLMKYTYVLQRKLCGTASISSQVLLYRKVSVSIGKSVGFIDYIEVLLSNKSEIRRGVLVFWMSPC